eukprot:14396478-Ditylum_brightwellii.AAC.1
METITAPPAPTRYLALKKNVCCAVLTASGYRSRQRTYNPDDVHGGVYDYNGSDDGVNDEIHVNIPLHFTAGNHHLIETDQPA